MIREEVQSLFKLGKEVKKGELNIKYYRPATLHQHLKALTAPKPSLSLEDMRWWMELCLVYGQKMPQWMKEAYKEAITTNKGTK